MSRRRQVIIGTLVLNRDNKSRGSRGRTKYRGCVHGDVRQQRGNNFTIASVNLASDDRLPILQLDVFGLKIDTLLDSGAVVSPLSPDMLDALKQTEEKIKYLWNRITIQTFDNSIIPFRQRIKITFTIHNDFVTGTFYVTT